MPGLEIRNLTVEYALGDYLVRPVDNTSLEALDGELVVLLGPSGCGKTTLLSCLGGLLRPTSGTIKLGDVDVTALPEEDLVPYRRGRVGIVFQAFNLVPSLTAQENVAAPLFLTGYGERKAMERARELLERLGLGDRLSHRPGKLSGGQQQRVALARALGANPSLILADEPTANLDYVHADSVIRVLRRIARPGRLVVVATHDHRLLPIADRVIDLAPPTDGHAGAAKAFTYAAGVTIFEQGDRGDLIFVIEQGEVDIVRVRADGSEEFVATVGPGDYFGELGPLLGFPRSASARARTDVVLTGYGAREFKDVVLPRIQEGKQGDSIIPTKPAARKSRGRRRTPSTRNRKEEPPADPGSMDLQQQKRTRARAGG